MRKILVCQTGGWIGDMVLLTPALRALKHAYPDSDLALLLRPCVAELMEPHPYIDRCIVDPKTTGRFRSLIGLIRHVRQFAFDMAIVLHPNSFRNALIPFLARIPVRVGTNACGRGILLTASRNYDTRTHEVHRYLQVLDLLNISTIHTSLEFWHTDTDRRAVQDLLDAKGVSFDERLIALNLGTTWRTKQWDIANFTEVIRQITHLAPDVRIVLIGAPKERPLADTLPNALPAINLVGETSVLQLGALLQRCEVCLTCDSGPLHIAAAVGTPTVALFGPTDPLRHGPHGIGHTVIERSVDCRPCYKRVCHRQNVPHLCMQQIDTTEVIETLKRLLQQKTFVA